MFTSSHKNFICNTRAKKKITVLQNKTKKKDFYDFNVYSCGRFFPFSTLNVFLFILKILKSNIIGFLPPPLPLSLWPLQNQISLKHRVVSITRYQIPCQRVVPNFQVSFFNFNWILTSKVFTKFYYCSAFLDSRWVSMQMLSLPKNRIPFLISVTLILMCTTKNICIWGLVK